MRAIVPALILLIACAPPDGEPLPSAPAPSVPVPPAPAPAPPPPAPPPEVEPGPALPASLQGKVELVPPEDPDHTRAKLAAAVKPAGEGGVSQGWVVRATVDLPVYRLWSGPSRKDSRGNTNRLGGWWAADAPQGPASGYRADYAICQGWNDLTWVAQCTLKQGAVVVVGPGQSVSAQTCGDVSGKESYAANAEDWQLYIDQPWTRGAELVCPPEADDYEADPADLSKPKAK